MTSNAVPLSTRSSRPISEYHTPGISAAARSQATSRHGGYETVHAHIEEGYGNYRVPLGLSGGGPLATHSTRALSMAGNSAAAIRGSEGNARANGPRHGEYTFYQHQPPHPLAAAHQQPSQHHTTPALSAGSRSGASSHGRHLSYQSQYEPPPPQQISSGSILYSPRLGPTTATAAPAAVAAPALAPAGDGSSRGNGCTGSRGTGYTSSPRLAAVLASTSSSAAAVTSSLQTYYSYTDSRVDGAPAHKPLPARPTAAAATPSSPPLSSLRSSSWSSSIPPTLINRPSVPAIGLEKPASAASPSANAGADRPYPFSILKRLEMISSRPLTRAGSAAPSPSLSSGAPPANHDASEATFVASPGQGSGNGHLLAPSSEPQRQPSSVFDIYLRERRSLQQSQTKGFASSLEGARPEIDRSTTAATTTSTAAAATQVGQQGKPSSPPPRISSYTRPPAPPHNTAATTTASSRPRASSSSAREAPAIATGQYRSAFQMFASTSTTPPPPQPKPSMPVPPGTPHGASKHPTPMPAWHNEHKRPSPSVTTATTTATAITTTTAVAATPTTTTATVTPTSLCKPSPPLRPLPITTSTAVISSSSSSSSSPSESPVNASPSAYVADQPLILSKPKVLTTAGKTASPSLVARAHASQDALLSPPSTTSSYDFGKPRATLSSAAPTITAATATAASHGSTHAVDRARSPATPNSAAVAPIASAATRQRSSSPSAQTVTPATSQPGWLGTVSSAGATTVFASNQPVVVAPLKPGSPTPLRTSPPASRPAPTGPSASNSGHDGLRAGRAGSKLFRRRSSSNPQILYSALSKRYRPSSLDPDRAAATTTTSGSAGAAKHQRTSSPPPLLSASTKPPRADAAGRDIVEEAIERDPILFSVFKKMESMRTEFSNQISDYQEEIVELEVLNESLCEEAEGLERELDAWERRFKKLETSHQEKLEQHQREMDRQVESIKALYASKCNELADQLALAVKKCEVYGAKLSELGVDQAELLREVVAAKGDGDASPRETTRTTSLGPYISGFGAASEEDQKFIMAQFNAGSERERDSNEFYVNVKRLEGSIENTTLALGFEVQRAKSRQTYQPGSVSGGVATVDVGVATDDYSDHASATPMPLSASHGPDSDLDGLTEYGAGDDDSDSDSESNIISLNTIRRHMGCATATAESKLAERAAASSLFTTSSDSSTVHSKNHSRNASLNSNQQSRKYHSSSVSSIGSVGKSLTVSSVSSSGGSSSRRRRRRLGLGGVMGGGGDGSDSKGLVEGPISVPVQPEPPLINTTPMPGMMPLATGEDDDVDDDTQLPSRPSSRAENAGTPAASHTPASAMSTATRKKSSSTSAAATLSAKALETLAKIDNITSMANGGPSGHSYQLSLASLGLTPPSTAAASGGNGNAGGSGPRFMGTVHWPPRSPTRSPRKGSGTSHASGGSGSISSIRDVLGDLTAEQLLQSLKFGSFGNDTLLGGGGAGTFGDDQVPARSPVGRFGAAGSNFGGGRNGYHQASTPRARRAYTNNTGNNDPSLPLVASPVLGSTNQASPLPPSRTPRFRGTAGRVHHRARSFDFSSHPRLQSHHAASTSFATAGECADQGGEGPTEQTSGTSPAPFPTSTSLLPPPAATAAPATALAGDGGGDDDGTAVETPVATPNAAVTPSSPAIGTPNSWIYIDSPDFRKQAAALGSPRPQPTTTIDVSAASAGKGHSSRSKKGSSTRRLNRSAKATSFIFSQAKFFS
ncbi:hypothetical protein EV182_000272 [Spiromyces aspiralis]|uniref:Uncharacterized protein n=1 Tax=Spiromyces aspiralis TaxID=68401 RepID=A0ACC1HIR9_9FUNG|nr:hypothetical protein EV182_000272 [Spiromyces aspiralis]